MSESFTNVAAHARIDFDDDGPDLTSGGVVATITYNAANRRYTLSTPTGSITFRPQDIDESRSDATRVVYARQNGGQTDTLTLTRPGTSGPLTYQYVGGAFWTQTMLEGSNGFASVDAFAYGVETEQADRRVSGAANYDIDLIGATTSGATALPLAGSGTAVIDFASGQIVFVGLMQFGAGSFFGQANISGSEPTFSGKLVFDDGTLLEASLEGRFFGPGSAELGGVFSAQSDTSNRVLSGVILGRDEGAPTPNTAFVDAHPDLVTSETFFGWEAGVRVSKATDGTMSNVAPVNGAITVRFDDASQTYLVAGVGHTFQVDSGLLIDTLDEEVGKFWHYTNGTMDYLRVYELRDVDEQSGGRDYLHAYQIFGMPTADGAVPVTGSASYEVSVSGTAVNAGGYTRVALQGFGDLSIDFNAGSIAAHAPVGYFALDDVTGSLNHIGEGEWDLTGSLASLANGLTGTITLNGLGDFSGTANGLLYGPGAEEVGGLFTGSSSDGALVAGAFFGDLSPPKPIGMAVPLTVDTTFASFGTDVVWGVGTAVQPWDAGTEISYIVADDTIRVELASGKVIDFANTSPAGQPFAQGQSVGGSGTDRLFVAPIPVDGVALSYLRVGSYTAATPVNGEILHSLFYFGLPTADMPVVGTAEYSTAIDATGKMDGTSYNLGLSSADFSVDFESGSVSTLLRLAGTPTSGGSVAYFGNFGGSGTISQSAFEGTFGGGATGGFWGSFFGPQAEEMGYYFDFTQANVTAQGSVVGRKE